MSDCGGPVTLVLDAAGRVLDASDGARAMFGDCVGRRCQDVVAMRGDGACRSPCHDGCVTALIGARSAQSRHARVRGKGSKVTCAPVGHHAVVSVEPVLRPVPAARLTPREREVLALVAEGLTTAEIARLLGLSFPTVRTHVEHAREKLGAKTRSEAVSVATQLDWL
jgi:DNA-binding CsgD family transcriptional regulator